MAQQLNVKTKIDGVEKMIVLNVLRSWSDASGGQIFLKMGGDYCYKNAEPIQSDREFNVITDKHQNEAAKSWWNRKGKQMSEAFYAKRDADFRKRVGDFVEDAKATDTELDQILYCRYEAGTKRPDNIEPAPWTESFKERPAWWGQASLVAFSDWIYEKYQEDKTGLKESTDTKNDSKEETTKETTPEETGKDEQKTKSVTGAGTKTAPGVPSGTPTGSKQPDKDKEF